MSRWRSHEARSSWWGRVRYCTAVADRWGKVGFQDRKEAELETVLLVEAKVQAMWDKWTAELGRLIKVFQVALVLAWPKKVVDWQQ